MPPIHDLIATSGLHNEIIQPVKMKTKKTILVVDDDPFILEMMTELLSGESLEVITASNANEGLKKFIQKKPGIVFTDLKMPGKDGLTLMEEIFQLNTESEVILFTSFGTVDTAVEAMKKGAYDYITKPVDLNKITFLIDRIFKSDDILKENNRLKNQLERLYGCENFIGESFQIQNILKQIQQVQKVNSTVLITGESGTGKELVANALHYSGLRRGKPFVKVNCAALAESVIESELFGHEKGAFTSAHSRRIGRFELADTGTIFLDEIGDISPSVQVKLLRVLENREFQRLGGNETLKTDVRLITATNRDLESAVAERTFREDLYYRLNVICIHIPALRERPEDIPLLATHFMFEYAGKMNKNIKSISEETMEILKTYHWPGNVRELENTIERAVVFCKNKTLHPNDLPPHVTNNEDSPFIVMNLPSYSLGHAEKILLKKVLLLTKWNMKKSAEMLDISRGTLYSKIEKYDIKQKQSS